MWGLNFATEARAMHDGEQPARSIYGEAKPEEAKALIEDGIRVAPSALHADSGKPINCTSLAPRAPLLLAAQQPNK